MSTTEPNVECACCDPNTPDPPPLPTSPDRGRAGTESDDEAVPVAEGSHIDRAAEVLAAEIHEAWEFQYDECDHGRYQGGHLHGEQYAMCRLTAERIVRRRDAADLLVVAAKAWDEGYTKACHDHGGYETCGQRGSHGRSNANPYLTEREGGDDAQR